MLDAALTELSEAGRTVEHPRVRCVARASCSASARATPCDVLTPHCNAVSCVLDVCGDGGCLSRVVRTMRLIRRIERSC
jgi:hypothetical protein